MTAAAAAAVLARLADGEPHGRAALAAAAGLDRKGLDPALALIRAAGAVVLTLPDGSLQLAAPMDRLEAADVVAELPAAAAAGIDMDFRFGASSSNDVLLTRGAPDYGRMTACLVEFQYAGRGRRGRSWFAPPGGALCLSVGWTFAATPRDLGALSLAVGVAAIRALESAAGVAAGVKWPNDLVWDERKLGGVLVEARSDAARTWVVVGIGINVRLDSDRLAQVSDWPRGGVDLTAAAGGAPPPRSRLAGRLLAELWDLFAVFAGRGFAPFADAWRNANAFADRRAMLVEDEAQVPGVVRGIDPDGALLFETSRGIRRVLAGEVSLRAEP